MATGINNGDIGAIKPAPRRALDLNRVNAWQVQGVFIGVSVLLGRGAVNSIYL